MKPKTVATENSVKMINFTALAREHGLEGLAAEVFAELQRWVNDPLEESGIRRGILRAASDVILDQHKQIEQLAAMTTI